MSGGRRFALGRFRSRKAATGGLQLPGLRDNPQAGAPVIVSAEKDPAGFLLKIEDEGESPVDCTAFVELDASNRRAGSSELGLAIARQNIDLLGASLSFQNRQPRGLQVVIRLPGALPDAMR